MPSKPNLDLLKIVRGLSNHRFRPQKAKETQRDYSPTILGSMTPRSTTTCDENDDGPLVSTPLTSG